MHDLKTLQKQLKKAKNQQAFQLSKAKRIAGDIREKTNDVLDAKVNLDMEERELEALKLDYSIEYTRLKNIEFTIADTQQEIEETKAAQA